MRIAIDYRGHELATGGGDFFSPGEGTHSDSTAARICQCVAAGPECGPLFCRARFAAFLCCCLVFGCFCFSFRFFLCFSLFLFRMVPLIASKCGTGFALLRDRVLSFVLNILLRASVTWFLRLPSFVFPFHVFF